jgi:hypothetical protein
MPVELGATLTHLLPYATSHKIYLGVTCMRVCNMARNASAETVMDRKDKHQSQTAAVTVRETQKKNVEEISGTPSTLLTTMYVLP